MKTIYTIALASIAITGCSSSEAATTTVDVAPPTPAPTTTIIDTTTIAPTTTSPPPTTTTAPPTTAAPTTAPRPFGSAQVLADRHQAFGRLVDACATDPESCDPAESFTEYVSPESEQYQFYAEGIDGLIEIGQRITDLDRVKRRVVLAVIENQGSFGHTISCVEHGAVFVESTGETLPDQVAYWREDFYWEPIDNDWIATSGVLVALDKDGDDECSF